MKNGFFRRKKSLVDREVQIGLASIILGYLILYTIFLFLLLGVPIWFINSYTAGNDYDRLAAIGKFILDDQRFWVLIGIFIAAVSLHSIFVTRKFAGPIFVFRRHLRRAQNGELSRIHLRKEDSFHDIKDLINDHFDQICDTMSQLKSGLDTISSKLSEMEKTIPTEHTRNFSELATTVQDQISKLDDICKNSWNYSA